jgi:hypothetical protein
MGLDFTPTPSSTHKAQLTGRMLRAAPPSIDAQLIQQRDAAERKLNELRCALAHLVGYWGVDAADKPYAAALESVLKEHR